MFPLSNEDRRALLQIARRAISSAVIEKSILDLPPDRVALLAPGGAFVTLHRGGRLRGCVGHVQSQSSLVDTVARAAISAALHDPRFPPVTAEEITSLEIEISILSALERVAPESILVGIHGLMVVKGESRGLLLPQVAVERGWASQRFLEQACVKAGLPEHAWREPSMSIFAFTAEVFSESTVHAAVES
jgi:AmmeMemoRadiSam system protein A